LRAEHDEIEVVAFSVSTMTRLAEPGTILVETLVTASDFSRRFTD